MAILKSEIRNKFTTIPNSVVRAKDVSDGDYRLMIYLYSLPNGWKINQGYLGVELNCNRRNISAKIKRLKEAGYLEIIRANKEAGADYIYVLKEKDVSVNDVSVNDVSVNDVSVNDVSVNDTYINTNIINTNIINTKLNSDDCKNSSKSDKPKPKNNLSDFYILILNFISDNNYSERLEKTFEEWLKYKDERKDKYTEMGLKKLLSQIKNNINKFGEENVINLMNECMANGYKGIIFEKLKKDYKKLEPSQPVPNWFDKDIEKEELSQKEQQELEALLNRVSKW